MIFVLIIAGGLVTSTGSGLSVPDWPLSYGQVMPPMVGGIRYEHSHRLVAGFVGFLTLGFFLLSLKLESRSWMKKYSFAMLLAVGLQAVLGGLTVIYLLPTPISVFHACLGQTFLCMAVLAAYFTSDEWKNATRTAAATSLKPLTTALAATFFLQLVLGAVVRHTDRQMGVEYHISVAFLAALGAVFVVWNVVQSEALRKIFLSHGFALAALVVLQVFLGFLSYLLVQKNDPSHRMEALPVILKTAHQANGAAILALSVLLAARVKRQAA